MPRALTALLMRESRKTDLEQFDTPEFWVKAGQYGDCEDYALAKRKHCYKQVGLKTNLVCVFVIHS